MSKVTKWAVETARSEMRNAAIFKLNKWDAEHPLKSRVITDVELAEIAVKDPAWLKRVVSHIREGYTYMDIRRNDLLNCSPKAAEAVKKNSAVDAPRNKARAAYETAMNERIADIIRQAVIGDMTNAELLQAVNEFCKA